MMNAIELCERGFVPDWLTRFGIRRLCKNRLHAEAGSHPANQYQNFMTLIEGLRQSPIAIHTEEANEQHYELPPGFFTRCLGKHLKYSSCYWDKQTQNLDQAEATMLQKYLERAELTDGMQILELGCGWGSLTLWMAEHLPNAKITAVSNSASQREFIQKQMLKRGIENVEIITSDVNQLQLDHRFDRVVSIEMFEHMRNYQRLMNNIAQWLRPGGKLFVHIFCHREYMYPFDTDGNDDWMAKYFFTGGLMPAADTLLYFQDDLKIEQQWRLSGTHYEKTANAWLQRTDQNRDEILSIFNQTYGEEQALLWYQRWRIFYMACAELFGLKNGTEWMVGHYRFIKPQ